MGAALSQDAPPLCSEDLICCRASADEARQMRHRVAPVGLQAMPASKAALRSAYALRYNLDSPHPSRDQFNKAPVRPRVLSVIRVGPDSAAVPRVE